MSGYVKLWRKSLDGGWLQHPELWVFWCWCLLKASYKTRNVLIGFKEINIEPGQFIFGRKKCSIELGLSEQTVRTCLQALKSTGNVTIKSTSKFSIITIVNWERYQVDENETNQQTNQQTNQRLTNNQPTTNHKQEGKESKEYISSLNYKDVIQGREQKNVENIPYAEIQKAFNEILDELPSFRDMTPNRRKAIKARWTTDDKTSTLEWWTNQFFPLIAQSDFLTGRNGRWTSCNIDWILKQSNFQKIREGTYNR